MWENTTQSFWVRQLGQVPITSPNGKDNGDIKNVLETDKRHEHGFDHMAGGFDADLSANQVFGQWISLPPTDHLVTVAYQR